ncbi:MAG TPA: M48 family metallopeptidase [Fimbriimonadaceae bacterium]|nr:M48 family metallopeptidase [Fimbriimonadaceae bacterium]
MRRSLPEQVAANKNASVFYGFLLVLLLAGLIAVIAGYYEPRAWPLGAAAGAGLGLVLALIAWYGGPGIVLGISHAREATTDEHRTLNNVAEEMAIAAGIPVPKVMVIDDSAPNAFATGRDPRSGVVVFTTGILEKLNRDELQGVMAHEIAHIRNYDIRFMTTVALIAGVIPLISDMFWRAQWYGGGRRRSSDRDSGGAQVVFMILAIVLVILAPIFAKLLELAVSRRREFLADATAAELTRNPEGLASALIKLTNDPEPLEAANRATQHLYIVNPLKSYEAKLSALFSTHPPTEERVKALRNIMGVVERPQIGS